jgi:hypothetical protein
MRFLALLRKELRESLPWMLLAGLLVLAVGFLDLRAAASGDPYHWSYRSGLTPGETVNSFRLTEASKLDWPGLWLALIAPGLGLVLGVRQFWVPLFTQTWAFLLHRSVRRMTVFWAKLAATSLAFVVSLGLVWTGLYWYACRPNLFPIPESPQVLVNGWIYVVTGLIVYLGTALSALSTARWYTSRIFGLAFATLATLVLISQWHPAWIVALMTLIIVILLTQVIASFQTREF